MSFPRPSAVREQVAVPPFTDSSPRHGFMADPAARTSPILHNSPSTSNTYSHNYGDTRFYGEGQVSHFGDVHYWCVQPCAHGNPSANYSLSSEGTGNSDAINALPEFQHCRPEWQVGGGPMTTFGISAKRSLHLESPTARAIIPPSPEAPNEIAQPKTQANDEQIGNTQQGEAGSSLTPRNGSLSSASSGVRSSRGGVWQQLLYISTHTTMVELSDGDSTEEAAKTSANGCRVILEELSNDVDYKRYRLQIEGLQLEQQKAPLFWIPLTNNRVSRKKSKLVVRHSNCIQRRNDMKNRINYYSATYDHTNPNVKLEFVCEGEADAKLLEHHLLLLDEPLETEDVEGSWSGQSCQVRCAKSKSRSLNDRYCLFLWRDIQEQRTLDLGYFSDKIDFEIKRCEQSTFLHIRHLRKLQYVLDNVGYHASWPPDKVKDNEDGGPAHTKLGESTSDDNSISIPAAGDELALLNATIGRATSWKVQDCWQIEARSKAGLLNILGSSFKAGSLTMWIKGGAVRCLIRYNASSASQWLSWTLPPAAASQCQSTTFSKPHINGLEVTLADLSPCSGYLLSMNPDNSLQPIPPPAQRRRSSVVGPEDAAKVQIRFSKEADKDGFLSRHRPLEA